MNESETRVHHAIIDLHELHDASDVTASEICNETGMMLRDVRAAMRALEGEGIIMTEFGSVVYANNLDYYPTTEEAHS